MNRIHQIAVLEQEAERKQSIRTVRLRLVAPVKQPIEQEKTEAARLERDEKLDTITPENKETLNNDISADTEIVNSSQKAINEENAISEGTMKAGQSETHIKVTKEKEPEAEKLPIPEQCETSETSKEGNTEDFTCTSEPTKNKEVKTTKHDGTVMESAKSSIAHRNNRKDDANPLSLQRNSANGIDVDAKMSEMTQKYKSLTYYQDPTNKISKASFEGIKGKQSTDNEKLFLQTSAEFDTAKSKMIESNLIRSMDKANEGNEKRLEEKRDRQSDKSNVTSKPVSAALATTNENVNSNQCITGAMCKMANAKQIVKTQSKKTQDEIIGFGNSSYCQTSNVLNSNNTNQDCKTDQTFIKERWRQQTSKSSVNTETSKQSNTSLHLSYSKTLKSMAEGEKYRNMMRPNQTRTTYQVVTTGFYQSTASQVKESRICKSQYEYTVGRYEPKPQLQQPSNPFEIDRATYNNFWQTSPPVLPVQKVDNTRTCRPTCVVSPMMKEVAPPLVGYRQSLECYLRSEATSLMPRTRIIEPIISERSYFEPEPMFNRNGMLIYCLKCRRKTDTCNSFETVTVKGQPIMKGYCVVCDRKKCCFMKRR